MPVSILSLTLKVQKTFAKLNFPPIFLKKYYHWILKL